MTQPTDDRQIEAEEADQDFTVCQHCGGDLPHLDCQNDEREEKEF
jgi:hypothetical protein